MSAGNCPECDHFLAYGHAFRCSKWTERLDGPAPRHGPEPKSIQCESCWFHDLLYSVRDECSPCVICGEQWPAIDASLRRRQPKFRQQDHDESGPPSVGNWRLIGNGQDLLDIIRTYPDGQAIPRPLRVTRAA